MKENIRSVTASDATAIAEIYRPYVLDTAISFETDAPTSDEMKQRIEQDVGHWQLQLQKPTQPTTLLKPTCAKIEH
ncbi:MAG: N-acetyltransferase family protein [Pseudobdellovibrionaceae bacterium]